MLAKSLRSIRQASSTSSKQWLDRQAKDPYARHRQAPRGGKVLISRAHHKLSAIDREHHLLQPGDVVVDLGAAPGSWLAYAHNKVHGKGYAIGVDLLELGIDKSIPRIKGDFLDEKVQKELSAKLEEQGRKHVDVVRSDMMHNVTGNRDVDNARSAELVRVALNFAMKHFAPERGVFLAKIYRGSDADELIEQEIKPYFEKLQFIKPDASRKESREIYILARRGPPEGAEGVKHPVLDALALGVAGAVES